MGKLGALLCGVLGLAVVGCVEAGQELGGGAEAVDGDLCNGQTICDRAVDEVSFAGTHNSFTSGFGSVLGTNIENQRAEMAVQLERGVRAFMLDTWWHEGAGWPFARLCHGQTIFGKSIGCSYLGTQKNKSLPGELGHIREFLDAHPREVVMLILQPETLSGWRFRDAMLDAGIGDERVFEFEGRWPTLRELVESNRRIIVFAEKRLKDESSVPSWYLALGEHSFDSPYKAEDAGALSEQNGWQCAGEGSRGSGSAFYLLNHFVSHPTGDLTASRQVNQLGFLSARANACWAQVGKRPNVVAVDYADQSGWTVVQVARALNEQEGPR